MLQDSNSLTGVLLVGKVCCLPVLGQVLTNFVRSSLTLRCCVLHWCPRQHWWHAVECLCSIKATSFLLCPRASGLGWVQLGGGTVGHLTTTGQRFYMLLTLCSATKLCQGGCFPEAAVAWRLAGHRSAAGRWWVIALASLSPLFCPLHLLNCLNLDPWVFLAFALWFSP